MAAASQAPDRNVTRHVLGVLRDMYGRREWHPRGSAVEVLVATILSQNTSRQNSTAGMKQLRRAFGSWTQVADAEPERIVEAIRISGLSNIKAPRIRAILRQLRADRGRVSLAFLRYKAPDEARRYLLAFDGVGPKTASCVLLFAFNMAVFPVDTHIVRIAIRMGWMPVGTSAGRCEELLTPAIAPDNRYEMHLLLIEHGRRTCKARNPRCTWCDLLDACPAGRRRVGPEC